jgi:hypothetical protein
LSRCGCGGAEGSARTICGKATVPAINDRKSRRFIVLDYGYFPECVQPGSDAPQMRVTKLRRTHLSITEDQQYVNATKRFLRSKTS